MMKRFICFYFLHLCLLCPLRAEILYPLNAPQNVQLGGEFYQRIQLVEKRLHSHPFDLDLIVQDVARIPAKQRRFEEYEGDVSGRYLGASSYISRFFDKNPARLDSLFQKIISYQQPSGYFGQDQKKMDWDYWGRQLFGHGRLLGGLVQYYHLTQNPLALEAAAKLGDYLISTVPQWTNAFADNPWENLSPWVEWKDPQSDRQHFVKTHMLSILESLIFLYEIKPDPAYLTAAEQIVALFPEFGHYHSHSFLNAMNGMALLYAHTGNKALYDRLHDLYWQNIVRHGLPADGGIPEWFPDDHRTEGCSVTDWIRLNLTMWAMTNQNIYLDEAETAWYNALYFHQTANGAFGHALRTPAGYGSEYSESWWCCTMHGLWAFADLLNMSACSRGSDVYVNFYTPLKCTLETAGQPIHLAIETDYPNDGKIQIKLDPEHPLAFTLHLRIPSFTDQIVIKLNGQPLQNLKSAGALIINRTWKKGDVLLLHLGLPTRIIDHAGNDLLRRRELIKAPYYAAIWQGPLMLIADQANNSIFPELIYFDRQKNYSIACEKSPFVMNQSHKMMPALLNGFESTVVLSPLSEKTGQGAWSEEWRNFMRNGEQPIQRSPVQHHFQIQIKK